MLGVSRAFSTDRVGQHSATRMSDPFDLNRFVQAQDPILAQVRLELGVGRKRTHWMWFVFPQISSLGHSATA